MLVDKRKLKQYIENDFNVLFEGERGVGKTATILSTFKEAGLRVKYFSAPTMDPWTDLVGVPSTVTRTDGKEVLRMIPPEDFADDLYDVIFIDELNRAPSKVLNALMELIQFGTINGKEYKIRMIWAAINPYTEEEIYDVNPLDPALKDRFQIHIKIPYKVDELFFKESLGNVGVVFADWWKNQPVDVQKEISPRRLYESAKFYINGGDFKDMIDKGNLTKLSDSLKSVSQLTLLEQDFANKEIKASATVLNKNYSNNVVSYLTSKREIFEFFVPKMDQEWLANEFIKGSKVQKYLVDIVDNTTDNEIKEKISSLIKTIAANSKNSSFIRNNITIFKNYLSKEEVKEIEEKAKNVPSLSTNNAQEANLMKTVFPKDFVTAKYKTGATELNTQYSKGSVVSYANKIISDINKYKLDANRIKDMIAFRFAAMLVVHKEQSKTTSALFTKFYAQLVDNSSTNYYWTAKGVPSELNNMGDLIKNYEQLFLGLNADEIKEKYLEATSKNVAKKKMKI